MVVLELKLPKEILKPVRAMEQVMASIHGPMFHPPDPWEEWVDGQVQLSIAFEIVSIEGNIHFYVRMPTLYREAVEANLYSQYPEIEITEVDDYTKYVPQNIPNKEWDLWGSDYKTNKDDHLPIKTYLQFETEQEKEQEQKVDPISTLLESMSKVGPGEQLWVQILAEPTAIDDTTSFKKWLEDGKKLRDKMANRTVSEEKDKSILQEAIETFWSIMVSGKPPEEEKKKEDLLPPEMKLTPGEREEVSEVERKMSKPCFITHARFIFLGRRDSWYKPKFRMAFSFFNDYATVNLNALYPMSDTITKIKKIWIYPLNKIHLIPSNIFRLRRLYLRQRKMFKNYKRRYAPFFPWSVKGKYPGAKGSFILNSEELASLFHFPSRGAAPGPGLARIESKRGALPAGLPSEDVELLEEGEE